MLSLRLNLDLRNNHGASALWLALQQLEESYLTSDDISEFELSFSARLIKRGSNSDAVETRTGNSLLHRAALEGLEAAAIFLVHHGAITNHKNIQGETPIHIAAKNGLHRLVEVLLQNGADPNLQTALKPKLNPAAPPPLTLPEAKAPAEPASRPYVDPVGVPGAGPMQSGPGMDAGDMMGAGILSPSTIGALNALSFTSQVCYLETISLSLLTFLPLQAIGSYSVVTPITSGYNSMVGLPGGGGSVVAPSPKHQQRSMCIKY